MADFSRDDRTKIGPSQAPSSAGPQPGDFAPGEVVGGNYRIIALIGRGGMGSVWRVHHIFLDKDMALKTLSGNQITENAWKRFQIEGQAIARLDHPNIIRIYDLGIVGQNQPYYVMDLVEGVSLAQLIEQEGALKPSFALPIFRQVSAALAFAHERGIIHRDLKPANIMLVQNQGGGPTARILDFGLAKLTDLAGGAGTGLTKTGEIFGSPLYMSPEQARGLQVDITTDVYSFGCTLFEALTGEPPIKGATAVETMLKHQNEMPPRLAKMREDLQFTPDLERFVGRLLEKNPADRYRNFSEIASQLLTMERALGLGVTHSYKIETAPHVREEENQTGEFTDPPENPITSQKWFWPSVAAGALVCAGAVGALCFTLFTTPRTAKANLSDTTVLSTTTTTTTTTGSTERQPAAGSAAELTSRQPFSHIEKTPSGAMRVFDFPSQAIGTITIELDEKQRARLAVAWQQSHPGGGQDPYLNGVPAEGKQTFPANLPLGFTPRPDTCNTPAVFKRFRADDLTALYLATIEYVNSDFMPYIKHLTGLRNLELQDTEIDDKAIKVLDGLNHVEWLSIDRTKITGAGLAKSQTIKQVPRISYSFGSNLDALISALDGLPNIRELRFNGAPLNKADLKILAHMPNLSKLCINHCEVDDDGVKILTASGSIHGLDVQGEKITPASIDSFAAMDLHKLSISGTGWSDADKARLKDMLSRHDHNCELQVKSDSE